MLLLVSRYCHNTKSRPFLLSKQYHSTGVQWCLYAAGMQQTAETHYFCLKILIPLDAVSQQRKRILSTQ